MRKKELLDKIKKKAKQDAKYFHDPRFTMTMGFLVAKGFLRVNYAVPKLPNKRIPIEDAIWAGQHVEPRILEVLPAAVLRLRRHFDLDEQKHPELFRVVVQLAKHQKTGEDFLEIPFTKLKLWANLRLKDGRVKVLSEKKIVKTFRLSPDVVQRIHDLAKEMKCSETEILERKILIK